jgi:hypothetical protein
MYFEVTGAERASSISRLGTNRHRTLSPIGRAPFWAVRARVRSRSRHHTCAILHRQADFGRRQRRSSCGCGTNFGPRASSCLFVRNRLFLDFRTCKLELFLVRSLKLRHVFEGPMTLHCDTCGSYMFLISNTYENKSVGLVICMDSNSVIKWTLLWFSFS